MAEINNNLFDGCEKDPFTVEQEEWFLQWNRLGRESQFQETQLMRLKKKLLNIEKIKQKFFKELQEKKILALLREDFEKMVHEFQYTKCQKDQLIVHRSGLLLELREANSKHVSLQLKHDEQSLSIQKIAQDFEIELLENEKIRLQLVDNLSSQDAKYLQQSKLLEEKTKECLYFKSELEKEREDMACPICFHPCEQTGFHRLVSLTCGHLFGDKCLREHLARLLKCPICRSPASTNHIIYIYGRIDMRNSHQ